MSGLDFYLCPFKLEEKCCQIVYKLIDKLQELALGWIEYTKKGNCVSREFKHNLSTGHPPNSE